jgi:predicted NACHT family NTPase
MSLTDGGYLDDPEAVWGRFSNPDVVPFEAIAKSPCLGLLGEPDMGKTRTMQAQREAIDRTVEEEGGQTLWLDLRSYGSEDRLIRNLFENQTFLSWVNGVHRLHVFLDSLDECLLRIDTLAPLLVDEFQKYSALLRRLYLRIACRTADWPNTLEEGLRTLWRKDTVGVYELAPLRRVDIVAAATADGLDADAFLREIDHKAVVPLAIKPVTVDFLLSIYRKHGQFPSTQTELYRQGCRRLREESNATRRDTGLTGTLTAAQRMAVAARIAAVTMFAKRYAVRTGLALGDVADEDDYREEQSPELSMHEAQQQFDVQAVEFSQQDMRIKAVVLNTALR